MPNIAPAGTNATVSIPRNYALRLSNFGFSDSDGNSLAAVRFTTLPTAGTLYFDSNGALGGGRVAVTAGQTISAADIAAGKVTFVADPSSTGANYASLTFQVQDNGGTADGGVDLDPTPDTLTFDIATGFSFGTVIDLDPANFPATLGFKIQGDVANDRAGFSVSAAGDINGDGFADLVVGAWANGSGGAEAGAAHVIFGGATGFGSLIDLTGLAASGGFKIQGDLAGDGAGYSVSSAGDVNGDGFADLIIGARGNDSGGTNAGAAYVIFGKASGFGSLIDLTGLSAADGFKIQGDVASDFAGSSVSGAGDINGDGFADFVIGAQGNDSGGSSAGAAYVIFGKASGFGSLIDLTDLTSTVGFKIQGDVAGELAGFSVSGAGDINGDGFADIIVGAPDSDTGGTNSGAAYVIFGKASGFGSLIDLTTLTAADGFKIQGDLTADLAGRSVSAAGDVNGDGFADLIVGAVGSDGGRTNAGAAFVLFGKASGFGTLLDLTALSATDGFKIQGEVASDQAGHSVSAAGDVNGDGFGDLLIGSRFNDSGGTYAGAAYVIFGRASGFGGLIDLNGLSATDGFKIQGDVAGEYAGHSVSAAGDVNGDGFADLIVGAYRNGSGGTNAGAAYVIFGHATPLLNIAPAGTDATLTINEDAPRTLTAADFGFADTDGNSLLAVRITTLPTAGALTLNGTAVTAGQTIPVASLPQLVFTPALNANGTGYASLTFQVQDNGGTADGGVDIDQNPNTLTFDVTALDDAPVLTATGVNPVFVENGSPVDIYNSVSASTIEAGQVFTGFTMTVSNVFSPANERLTFDGATFTLQDGSGANPTVNGLNIGVTLTGTTATVSFSGASLTAAQLQTIIDQMTYQQFGDAPVDGDRVFTITQLIDSGSSVAPNANTTMLALSSTVNVNPVNDAPTFTGLPLNFQLTSNATLPLDFSTVTVTDPDSIVTTTISASQGGTLAAAGGAGITIGGSGATLTLTGTAAALTSYFDTVANITYTPALNFSGNGNAFTFGVSDGALSNSVGIGSVVVAPISLTTPGLALAQNFDALASTGTTNQLTLAGWSLNESGASSTNNELYSGGTGTSATGDVYSFGATAGDRALGTLLSGTLAPTFGVAFTNNTGGSITALQIAFTGEQWRIGNISAGRAADRLDFQLSTNATSLTNGAWTDYNSLDFSSPVITGGATGSLDGNAAANRTSFNLPITNIAIAPGGTFWLRWVDFDVTGADDGLAIDNFSIIAFTNTAAVLDLNGADAGSDNSASYIEQAPIVTLASGLSLSDADNATLTGATVRITSGFVPLAADGADYLGINGSGAGTISGINYSYSALTGILTLSGTASVAAYEAVLAQVSFQSTTNNPGTSRTVTWTVNDGTVDSAPVTTTISVTPVDDAPMAVGDSATVDENATVIINVTGNDTDVDGGPLAVTQVNGIAATVGTAITLASGALLTLRADGGFDFDPNGRFNSLIDGATAAATGATNTEAFLNFTYTLTGGQTALVSVRIGGVASAGDQLGGSGGNDVITGTAGNDSFNLGLFPGGNDNVSGNGGDDAFFFGATLNALDTVDGGSGNDQVGIVGNYTGANRLVLGATTLTNVEVLALLPGAGTGYDIVSNDANVAAGQRMTIFAGNLAAGQNFTFDGSAETDGSFLTYGGLGVDTVTGGALDDGFYFGPSKWQAGDTVTGGGGGNDQLALDGDYTITIGANADVETLALLGGPVSTPNTFNITLDDGWVGAGTSRIVWGGQVTTALTINGAGETNGNLTFFGGLAGDTLTGGAGDDSIWGAAGNDSITGGLGSDTANFSGLRADYSVVTNMGNVQIIDTNLADGDDGTDMVVGIEFARFADQTISITSPIILDLDGGGVETLSAAQSNARFDMDGDGIGDETSWFGRGEGLLFLDRDGNGTLSDAGEMSFTNDVANARSDLEGLAAWDSNGDGQLSKKDARFASFKIWRDRDGDGVVDAGEVMSLKKAGVRSLSLSGTNTNATTALGDVAIVNTGSFTRTSGRRGGLVDAVLTAVSSKDASDRAAQHSGVSGQVPVTAATAVDQALTLAPTDDPFAALMRSDGGDLGSLNRSLFTGSFAGAVAQLQPVLSEQRVMPVATDPLAERDAGDRALATANPLTTIDDYGNWMKPDSAPGLDQRVLLMAQDMASFGATGNGASESDRWRREGSAAAEMFAA